MTPLAERGDAAAPLRRYARFQVVDYLVERGISTALFGALIVLVPVLLGGAVARAAAPLLLGDGAARFGILGTLFAVNGISSTDRQRGYVRFLFSKPVSVPRFYAQDFILRGAALAAIAGALFGAFAAVADAPWQLWPLAQVALTYVLVGGAGFLLSALTHHDGIAVVLVFVGSTLVRAGAEVVAALWRGPGEALRYLSALLPPFHRLDALRDAFAAGTAPHTGDFVWVLAYGLGCFAAGLFVLRHRPLTP